MLRRPPIDEPASKRLRPLAVTVGGVVAAAVGAVTLAACGGGSSGGAGGTSSATASGAPAAQSRAAQQGGAGFSGRGPAASGTIAEVDGTTMQVQSQQDGQVAVAWSSKTSFTQQVKVALSTIKAGECVTAVAASSGSSSSASTSETEPLAATTITVTQPVDGQCGGQFGGRGNLPSGSRPSNFPSGLPSGSRPSGSRPSGGADRAQRGFGDIASGKVVSVSASSIVVAARTFSGQAVGQASTGSTPSATTTNRTVTVGASTKITTEQRATAAAVKVGRCASAQGTADSSGTVAATQVAITDPVDGACTGGFGRGGAIGGGTGA